MSEPYKHDDDNNVLAPDREKLAVKPPPMYMVVILNDDYTTMEYVVYVLMQHFAKTLDQAMDITMDVHEKGKGIAGTYPKDIAESKAMIVMEDAQTNGFPLRLQVEEGDSSE